MLLGALLLHQNRVLILLQAVGVKLASWPLQTVDTLVALKCADVIISAPLPTLGRSDYVIGRVF